ncbi:hypothetical protein JCM11491_006761 [Sporobolomyces phaffii]
MLSERGPLSLLGGLERLPASLALLWVFRLTLFGSSVGVSRAPSVGTRSRLNLAIRPPVGASEVVAVIVVETTGARQKYYTYRGAQEPAGELAGIMGGQGININDIIRIGKKLFTFYKKWSKKHQQQQAQQHQQQQYPQQNQYQGGGGGGYNQSSPYPPVVGQAHQGQNGWNQPHQQQQQQPHYGGGGYGAHDGKPTNYDMSNAQNAHYVELRNKAIHEGDLMAKCFADSQRAYTSGDGNAAHNLSLEGKEHQRMKEQYNDQAAQWIFNENNKVQPVGSVDLHGLYVQESIEFTERAIDNARNQGLSELRVIVGKGNHSPSHVAKLKPAITSLMSRKRLTAHLDPHNAGVLVVQLQQQGGGSRAITGGDELVRSIGQKDDGGCLIM